jgi:hypothetical protein
MTPMAIPPSALWLTSLLWQPLSLSLVLFSFQTFKEVVHLQLDREPNKIIVTI